MSALFTINFRREAHAREVARARRRVMALGVWVTYFGVLSLMAGLYALNCVSLTRRTTMLERQIARSRGTQTESVSWGGRTADLNQVERFALNPRNWHNRLARLSTLLPANVKLHSIAVNPKNLANASDQEMLVFTGVLQARPGQDRMQGVMKIVSTLHDDSVFARSYRNIKLASTRISEDAQGAAEFVIECR